MKHKKQNFSRELVQLYLDLSLFEPNYNLWSEIYFIEKQPVLIRFKKLNALLSAVNCNLSTFVNGEFLKDDDSELLETILFEINKTYPKLIKRLNEYEFINTKKLNFLFTRLLEYRTKVELLFDCNSNVLAVSGFHTLLINLTFEINKKIKRQTNIIDNILLLLIEPLFTEVTLELLVENFNYPNVDLDEIDLENI
jgi:hypothetical protein